MKNLSKLIVFPIFLVPFSCFSMGLEESKFAMGRFSPESVISETEKQPLESKQSSPLKQFLDAAEEGNIPAMRDLLAQDPTLINQKDSIGWTALHCAASKCYKHNIPATVAFLLKSGARVDARSNDNYTALHVVSELNEEDIEGDFQEESQIAAMTLLLLWGANPNAPDGDGNTALHLFALEGSNFSLIPLLTAWGANLNINHQGLTALSISDSDGNEVFCDMLREALTRRVSPQETKTILQGTQIALSHLDDQRLQNLAIYAAEKTVAHSFPLWSFFILYAHLHLCQTRQMISQYEQKAQKIFNEHLQEMITDLERLNCVIRKYGKETLRKCAIVEAANHELSKKTGSTYTSLTGRIIGKRKRDDV